MTAETRDGRRPYAPPLIRKVRVVPEELAIAGCKTSGPSPRTCRQGTKIVSRTWGS